jgi:ribosomal protein S18 acetylase RimI-like enzyme
MKTDEEIEIHEFRAEDMNVVTNLLQGVSSFETKNEDLERLANLFLAGENNYACVAINEGCVVGFASVFLLQRIRGGCSAVIEDVVVSSDTRRKGVGRLLVSSLLEYAIARKCFKVSLVTTDENIAFYESLGFQKDLQGMRLLLKTEKQS